jgi:branched-chain amino acid transport system permease protein
LGKTITGKVVLAVIHDRDISAAVGVNVTRVFVLAFTFGVFLAAPLIPIFCRHSGLG